jgi:DNA primase
VEGPLDVWRIGPGAVCTCGTAFTRTQLARAVRFPVRAVCYDNEPTAQRRARKLVKQLEVFPGKTMLIQLESGKDPGSADESELCEMRRKILQ